MVLLVPCAWATCNTQDHRMRFMHAAAPPKESDLRLSRTPSCSYLEALTKFLYREPLTWGPSRHRHVIKSFSTPTEEKSSAGFQSEASNSTIQTPNQNFRFFQLRAWNKPSSVRKMSQGLAVQLVLEEKNRTWSFSFFCSSAETLTLLNLTFHLV